MDDDWVKAASCDGVLVAELLIRLHHSPPSPPPSVLPLKWSIRQPRTRSLVHKSGVTRGSPTTPLSWTGGSTSHSGGAAPPTAVDCSEESSKPGLGSKVCIYKQAHIHLYICTSLSISPSLSISLYLSPSLSIYLSISL